MSRRRFLGFTAYTIMMPLAFHSEAAFSSTSATNPVLEVYSPRPGHNHYSSHSIVMHKGMTFTTVNPDYVEEEMAYTIVLESASYFSRGAQFAAGLAIASKFSVVLGSIVVVDATLIMAGSTLSLTGAIVSLVSGNTIAYNKFSSVSDMLSVPALAGGFFSAVQSGEADDFRHSAQGIGETYTDLRNIFELLPNKKIRDKSRPKANKHSSNSTTLDVVEKAKASAELLGSPYEYDPTLDPIASEVISLDGTTKRVFKTHSAPQPNAKYSNNFTKFLQELTSLPATGQNYVLKDPVDQTINEENDASQPESDDFQPESDAPEGNDSITTDKIKK